MLEVATKQRNIILVIFDMWGQRCETSFDCTSELDYLTWLRTTYDKGWLLPIEIVSPDGIVLCTGDELIKQWEDNAAPIP